MAGGVSAPSTPARADEPPSARPGPLTRLASVGSIIDGSSKANRKYGRMPSEGDLGNAQSVAEHVRAVNRIASVWRAFLACRRVEAILLESYQPRNFHLKGSDESADFGLIAFESHASREAAPYIRVSDESKIDKVVGLVRTAWDVRDAQVVISLTGGAQDLKLKPHVHDVFNRGLVRAAQQTNAWIVTGGTDTGVMKLVGEALRDYQADVPCIGVTTWGVVHGREQLANNRGKEQFYRPIKVNDGSGAGLEPNHTHFLLVDTGKEGQRAWGGEIKFRTDFEQHYCQRYKVPMVLVVVGGSFGTLQTIERAAENEVPIVLISDSGGAPATLSTYMKLGRLELDPSGERGLKPPKSDEERAKLEAQVQRILSLHEKHKVLTSFTTRQGETRNLDLVLLKAMLFDTEGGLRQTNLKESKKMLHLAIDWGRIEVVSQWIEKSAAMYASLVVPAGSPMKSPAPAVRERHAFELQRHASSTRRMYDAALHTKQQLGNELQQALQEALYIALKHRKAPIVDLLLKANLQAADVPLLNLYHDTLETLHIFEADLQTMRIALTRWAEADADTNWERLRKELAASAPGFKLSPQAVLAKLGRHFSGSSGMNGVASGAAAAAPTPSGSLRKVQLPADHDVGADGASRKASLEPIDAAERKGSVFRARARASRHQARAQALYSEVVIPWLTSTCQLEPLDELWRAQLLRAWTVDDVMYWAVLMADEALVRVLWTHVDEPIRMALAASNMTSKLASLARFDRQRFLDLAHTYERWATGVLDQATNELEARWLLQQPFNTWVRGRTDGTLVTAAIRTQRKAFLAHAHTQSLLDAWWRGDIVAHFEPALGRGKYCLSSREPHALLVLAHALSFALLPLVEMEPTLAAKHSVHIERSRRSLEGRKTQLGRRPTRLERGGKAEASAFMFRQLQFAEGMAGGWRHMALDFYSAPKTKFWLRVSSYVVFLVLYATVLLMDDGTPDVSGCEAVFSVWVFGLAVDELFQFVTNRRLHRSHFEDIWNYLDFAMLFLVFPIVWLLRMVALATCCSTPSRAIELDGGGISLEPGGDCVCMLLSRARTMLAANAVLSFFRFLANFKVHPRLGVLIHVITEIQKDVGVFFAILFFVVMGFAFAFSGLAPPRRFYVHGDSSSPLLIPIWNLFDLSDVSDVTQESESPVLGMTLLATYLFLSQILLVNLLIAMMNTSYAEAHKNAEQEWASSRASSIEELLVLSPLPPPISAPWLLYELVRSTRPPLPRITRRASSSASEHGSRHAVKKRRNIKLLHEYLEQRLSTENESVESRVRVLRDEIDRLTNMVETASADRAESKSILDKLLTERAETTEAVAKLERTLEQLAGLVEGMPQRAPAGAAHRPPPRPPPSAVPSQAAEPRIAVSPPTIDSAGRARRPSRLRRPLGPSPLPDLELESIGPGEPAVPAHPEQDAATAPPHERVAAATRPSAAAQRCHSAQSAPLEGQAAAPPAERAAEGASVTGASADGRLDVPVTLYAPRAGATSASARLDKLAAQRERIAAAAANGQRLAQAARRSPAAPLPPPGAEATAAGAPRNGSAADPPPERSSSIVRDDVLLM